VEGDFLKIVGDAVLRLGQLDPSDLDALGKQLANSPFVRLAQLLDALPERPGAGRVRSIR
jgi:hypothetical protein